MHMKPGLLVRHVESPGTGQVTRFRDGLCEVLWRGGKRDSHPQSELVWVGLTIHTRDGRPGKVTILGREKIQVRFSDGKCCWVSGDELEPPEPKQDVIPES